jgi:hypothetical protein
MKTTDKNEELKAKELEERPEEVSYLLCRTPSLDCRIDQQSCVEGRPVGAFESRKEALGALRDEWEQGTCF